MSASQNKTNPKSATEPTSSFEEAYAELEKIVTQMESSQMPLETSLETYKRGNLLLEFCQKSLAEIEQQVKILSERQQLVPFNTDNE